MIPRVDAAAEGAPEGNDEEFGADPSQRTARRVNREAARVRTGAKPGDEEDVDDEERKSEAPEDAVKDELCNVPLSLSPLTSRVVVVGGRREIASKLDVGGAVVNALRVGLPAPGHGFCCVDDSRLNGR